MIKNTETITIEVPELSEAHIQKLQDLPHAYKVTYEDSQLKMYFSGGEHNLIEVLNYLNGNNVPYGCVYTELPTLNDVFLEITGKGLRD